MTDSRIYLGTWQLSGDFGEMTPDRAGAVLGAAWDGGITRFDTAAVYGGGSVEELLGYWLPPAAHVLTKVPATSKPVGAEPATSLYTPAWITLHVEGSLQRLRRSFLDTVLLHNWSPHWQDDGHAVLDMFAKLRRTGVIGRLGISLPNGYGARLPTGIVRRIQVVEAPLNPDNRWITESLGYYRRQGLEVILRSLFAQGRLIKPSPDGSAGSDRATLLRNAWALQTSLVFGATKPGQVSENLRTLKE